MRTVTVRTEGHGFQQALTVGPHHFISDEPADTGGIDAGPDPKEYLLGALGACTSMTVSMYAKRKGWPLESVEVQVDGKLEGGTFIFDRRLELHGALSPEQRQMLLGISDRCPVAKILSGTIRIQTTLVEPA